MPELHVDPIVKDFIEIFKESHSALGIDNLSISIMGILFFEPGEVSMEELARMTGYSLTSISQKLKYLSAFGIIKRRTRPGSKKVYLYVENDLFRIWNQQIKMHYQSEINIAKEKVPALIKKYESEATSQEDMARLEVMKNYYSQILQFEDVLNKLFEMIDAIKK